MARIAINRPSGAVDVDLWGTVFDVKPATRSVAREAKEYTERLTAAEQDGDEDTMVIIIGELLDLRLVPAEGRRKKASTLISEKWEADELTLAQLLDFVDDLGAARVRPT
jgi:hypothetical protein